MHLARAGHDAELWARDPALAAEMAARRANPVYLPGVHFPPQVRPTADLQAALDGTRFVVVAVPSHGMREILRRASAAVPADAVVVSATKGLEQESLYRMSEVVEQELGSSVRVAVLSGPSFASELAREMPTAMAVASRDAAVVDAVQHEFRAPYVRLYGTSDVAGVEMGGALKNVIAIAAGLVEGMGLGYNAQAGLITRGLAEMSRLACAAGAQRETLSGLAGLGDLVLTCTSGSQPQPASGHRAVARTALAGDPGRDAHGGRGSAHVQCRAGAGSAPSDRAADRVAGGGPAGGPEGPAHRTLRADGAAAAGRAGIGSQAGEVTRWGFSTNFGRG